MGLAMSYPGIDPRSWVTAGRVETDGLHWDSGVGWIVDVVPYGAALEGGDGIPVRIVSTGPGGSRFGEYIPPSVDAEVILVLSGGDPEQNPALVGYLTNEDDGHAPDVVNGLPISGEAAASSPALVSPFDTEIKRSPFHRREEYAGDRFTEAAREILISGDIRLGAEAVTEPALLGQVTVDNTNELLQALTQLAASLQLLVGPLSPLVAIGTALQTAIEALSPKIAGQLSENVKLK